MAVLASRKHYCVNKNVCMSDNIDEQCKLLLDDKVQGCPEFKNAQKLSRHPSLQKGGCYEVHDIEDLLRVGRQVKGCPYFAAQTMAETAQLVFCPYNYLISPIVRRAMDIDISGSIVILDEAHNIEDIARDAGSVDVDEESLTTLAGELANLATNEAVAKIYQPLHEVIEGLINWITDQVGNLRDNEFEHPASFWTGENAMKELQKAGITPAYFPILQECATKAVKAALDTESDGEYLTGRGVMTLDSLFSSLSHFFAGNGCHFYDYQLAFQHFVQREGSSVIGSRSVMSLWCLSPAVVFQGISDLTLSVILTSGTLSPMGSFASELGVQFDACMEAPHVIDADSQVFASVISSGPTKYPLNASYKTADVYSFQDELGASIEEICRIVPGGALVFFPSYKLLDKMKVRWAQTGQWARLHANKPVFVEPRGSTEELEPILKGYYDAILGKAPLKKGRGGAKQIVKNRVRKNSSQESAKGGAAFLAVCRGKVSEGIDFSDDNARVVVIVGIPFPNINDVQVKLKKRYNDSYKSSKHLLSGSDWYCHQAFRALNQAAGRCIRHKLDYGGIILIDERYQEERNLVHISKWLKNSIKHYGSFQDTMDGLEKFFQKAEEHIKIRGREMSPNVKLEADILPKHDDKRKLPWPEPNFLNQSILQSNQKVKTERGSLKVPKIDGLAGVYHNKIGMSYASPSSEAWEISSKSSDLAKKLSSPIPRSLSTACQLPPSYKIQYNLEGEADIGGDYEVNTDVIDLEKFDSKSWCSTLTIFNPSEHRLQQPALVEETFTEAPVASPSNHSEVNISAVMNNDEDQAVNVNVSTSLTTANRNHSCVSTSVGTPERTSNRDYPLEHEYSSVNRSVNSQYQKKRRFSPPISYCMDTEHSNPSTKSFGDSDCAGITVPEDLKRTGGLCCKSMNMSRCENFKLERCHKPVEFSPKESARNKLLIYCSRCKTPLGLQKDGFLVSCSLSSPSNFYLTYLLRHGLSSVGFAQDDLMASPPAMVNVIVCDASSLNQETLTKFRGQGSAHHSGVWSEKDGCVYKPVTCPFCPCENACAMPLGVRVLATDASNLHSLDRVLLFADRLDIKHESSNEQVTSNQKGAGNPMPPPPVIDLETFAYKPLKKDPVPLNTRRSKLRLPSTNKPTRPEEVHNLEDS